MTYAPAPVYLFGYLNEDFVGRMVVTRANRTVGNLAQQLTAWGPTPEYDGPFAVTNEAGTALDLSSTVAEAGLGNGDIFTVGRTE